MCLVSGDKGNLSSMPKGMKIISELLDREWKKRLDDFRSADMYNSVQRLAAAVQSVALAHFTLSEHIKHIGCPTWSHRKNSSAGKVGPLWPIQSCTGQAHAGRGRYNHTLYASTTLHSQNTVTPNFTLVTHRYEGVSAVIFNQLNGRLYLKYEATACNKLA